ncbi:MAG: efflux RND transporter permease subunit [Thermodesulfobacteriota bacterium]|nr:efflux RND transporter permease subunit [Thermodesulfobacteriota bacterium]
MKPLANWSVRNHVTVNVLMILIILAGLLSLYQMRREIFPQFSLNYIIVTVLYPGASPEEVEEGICIKIEEQIKGIEGVSKIISTAIEGQGSVVAELDVDNDREIQGILDDVKTEIGRIDTFPEDAEKPEIIRLVNREDVINVAVFGDVPEQQLREVAERIRDDLTDTKAISQANIFGVRDYEISVELSEDNLRRYGLTFDDVVLALRTSSLDLPAGVIKTPAGEVLIRVKGQRYIGEQFEEVPLITHPDGTIVRLGDVADIVDGFEDTDQWGRFNGKPMAMVQVARSNDEDIIEIARNVNDYVDANRNLMPDNIELAIWGDLSKLVQDRIDLMVKNGSQGIFLVFVCLALFLNFRLAFWVAFGIPISFMAAFFILGWRGDTINMISLFAFIMTAGILVDDAIIFGENTYSHFHRGKSHSQAVMDGMGEVGWPVVIAVTTTIVAFTPLMFIAGIMGKFIFILPVTVITILIASLGEALIILPAHLNFALSMTSKDRKPHNRWYEWLVFKMDEALHFVINNQYASMIRFVIKNKYFAFSIALGTLIIAIGLVIGGYVPFVLFPRAESDWIFAEVSYPLGTPVQITEEAIKKLENEALSFNQLYSSRMKEDQRVIKNILSLVGQIPRMDWRGGEKGGHAGQIFVELLSSEDRTEVSASEILNQWRDSVGEVPGVEKLSFSVLHGGPAGNPIEVQLIGHDYDVLKKAALEIKEEIASYPGTYDITDDFKLGKEEKKLRVKPDAKPLGVSLYDIARQVRQAFYGEEALRIQRGRDDLKVMVRYATAERRRLKSIEDMRVRTPKGHEIPLHEVAEIIDGKAYSVVKRVDRKRVITVIADIDQNRTNAAKIVQDLEEGFLPQLMRAYPGLSYRLEGDEKRRKESIDSLRRGYLLALMGIYLLLATQFRSYIQPVIIMIAIPFGLIGAVTGHLSMGFDLTLISLFGMVAVTGIVVNDSLILIDFINRAVMEGSPLEEAVETSGKARFRPVILTSVTTIAALLPLMLERSFQAQFLIPMAISITFGLLVATFLTLLLVPALYLIVKDMSRLFARFFGSVKLPE